MRLSFMTVAFGAVLVAIVTLLIVGPARDRIALDRIAPDQIAIIPASAPMFASVQATARQSPWVVPDATKLPNDEWGQAVRRGRDLIMRTYALIGPEVADPARRYAGNNLSCQSCHLQAGTKQFGLPLLGVVADYPRYAARAGSVGTISDRINGCMTRSMNGRPLPQGGTDLVDMIAYLKFLSDRRPVGVSTPGRGAGTMPELSRAADPAHGAAVYARTCAACHGADGKGHRVGSVGDAKGYAVPPLWGDDSFNDGAGMDRLINAANFVHGNMPVGTSWKAPSLSPPDAWDVTAFVLTQPRPHRAGLERDYPKRLERPVDSGYGPYADGFSQAQHRLGPFEPIRAAIARLGTQSAAIDPPTPLPAGK
jgi:thiosulfate dehydrogenase